MIKYKKIMVLVAIIGVFLIEIKANDERKVLIAENNKIYFSAFPDFGGSEDLVSVKRIDDFENLVGKKMAWATFSQNWMDGLDYPKDKIQTLADKGIIPYVRFLPRSALEQGKAEKTFTLEKIINGDFDAQLIKWAVSANEHNVPIIMDFGLEMNGDWFGWSGYFNGKETKDGYGDVNLSDGPEKYRDAYRHIIDIFRAQNVKHVTWFFHCNIQSMPNVEWNFPKYYYPGDDYIDWIGISIYGAMYPKKSHWETFDEILKANYEKILDISSNKPFAILEIGVTDHHPNGKKDKWLKDAFEIVLSQKYINFKAITYWHESWKDNGDFASLKIDSSVESLSAFKKGLENKKFTSKVILSK